MLTTGAFFAPTLAIMNIKNKMLFFKATMCFCLLFLLITGFSETPQDIAKASLPSTVLIVMQDQYGHPLSLGSGFFVQKGIVVSNFHVVENAHSGFIKLPSIEKNIKVDGYTTIDKFRDLVLLKISDDRANPLTLGDSEKVEVGEYIYAIGNPQGLEGTFSHGIVSGIRNFNSIKLLQITAPISPGSSGGPVINNRGEVIGVSVATVVEGQNLNFAVPSNYIKELLSSSNTVSSLPIKRAGDDRPFYNEIGSKSIESVYGENFTYDGEFQDGEFSFSLVNKLNEPIKYVSFLIVFYDTNDKPIEVLNGEFKNLIPASLAKRLTGVVHTSVEKLNNPTTDYLSEAPPRKPKGRVEIRILDYRKESQKIDYDELARKYLGEQNKESKNNF